jgi:hypothetical protein
VGKSPSSGALCKGVPFSKIEDLLAKSKVEPILSEQKQSAGYLNKLRLRGYGPMQAPRSREFSGSFKIRPISFETELHRLADAKNCMSSQLSSWAVGQK